MTEKNYSISIIRFISMLMIIFCHILQGLNNKFAFWINVGVQIFFFMSGYLYGKKVIKNIGEFYKKRIIKILLPYIILLTITLLLDNYLFKSAYPFKRIFGCYIGLGAFGNDILIMSHTWFVSYILLCYMFVPFFQMIFSNDSFKNNFISMLLLMITIQIFHIYYVVNIEACWINNFILGYFYSKCCCEKKEKKAFNCFVITLFIIVMPIAVIYQEHIPIVLPNILNLYSNIIVNYGHVLLGTVIFITLYELLNKYSIKNNKILSFSDNYSYYIYLVHQIFILNSFSVLYLTKYLGVNIILIFLFSILSAIVLKFITDLLISIFNRFNYILKQN